MTGLDFSSLVGDATADTATEPRRIFSALPSKDPKYGYARDVQTEVWERWHTRRAERDLVIKMNTGGGKTVVGLLVLKSSLNEAAGPVVYVAPDIYLAEQVRVEAAALGIETTDDPRSARFHSGKAILVVNVYKLINGLSVFGVVGSANTPIEVGTLLVDDVHACLATVEEQFTLRVPAGHPACSRLFELFKPDLLAQSAPSLWDLVEGDPTAVLAVPYWAWVNRQDKVLEALHPHRLDEGFKFVWPLIKESLSLCRVAVSSAGFEIQPPCPPVDRIPSLASAKRRIYLTATLADDSVLVTHFAANAESVAAPITPKTADDLGDRMILAPLETFPTTSREEMRDFLVEQAKDRNVVVIVPSNRTANFWRGFAQAVHDSSTIHAGVASLRAGHVGLVVLINKYDGIDLPGDACHVLALDGVPEAYGALDRIEALALEDSEAMVIRQIQRIEQGMGRGVRSNDDFCVVLLVGSRLTQRIHSARNFARFSPATRAQLKLSDKVADMLHERPFADLEAVMSQCLQRDRGWVTASRDVLDGVTYDTENRVSHYAVAEREAFDLAVMGRHREAHMRIQQVLGGVTDTRLRGWLKQQAAAYLHLVDPVAAQVLQVSAQTDNRAILKPMAGVEYTRLGGTSDQAQRAVEVLSSRYDSGPALIVGFAGILDDLVPDPDPAAVSRFEQAVFDLGLQLGFGAQRPERDTGEGPDVLWLLGELNFLVIECKSGVTTDFISKHDAAQLSHSIDWFKARYDDTCTSVPIMVHKTAALHQTATARSGMQVVTFDRLGELREAVMGFAQAIATDNGYRDQRRVAEQLNAHHLNGKGLIAKWGKVPRKS